MSVVTTEPANVSTGVMNVTKDDESVPVQVRWARLTAKEKQVARLLARGFTYDQAGDELGIKYHTVNSHVKAIYKKFGVHSKTRLCALLIPLGFHEEPPPS